MEYRREIDGLRAIAVLPVILFHAGFKAFEGGFIGVDVFFVISGYLITTIILTDMDKGKFSIVTFYERRARRILPALYFVMLCCFPFAWLWLMPKHLKEFSQSLTAVSVFSSNILFSWKFDYFATEAELKPLLHTWSLAIEEQYYVLFPLFLMAMRRLRKRWIFGSLTLVALFSLGVSQWGAYNRPTGNFFLLPTRGWELAIGALISFYFLYKRKQADLVESNKIVSEVLSLLGFCLIFYSVFAFNENTPFPSLYALIPTTGTALIIIFSTSDTAIGRLLATKPMVGIGLISYSTYLWHQPLFVFARHRSLTEPSVALLLALSALSIVLAYFSWRFVEMPFRDRKAISRKNIFCYAVVGSVFFAATGLTGYINNGFGKRTNNNGIALAEISNKIVYSDLSKDCGDNFTLSPNCRTSDEPEILVWGDSNAGHLVKGILASNPRAKIIQMTKSECGPFFDVAPVLPGYPVGWAKKCQEFNNSVHDWLKSNKTVKYAVLSSPFSQYLEGSQILVNNKIHDANKKLATEHIITTLEELKRMGITPVVFSPTPQNGRNIGECLVKTEMFSGDFNACGFSRNDATDSSKNVYDFLNNIAKNYKVVFLDKAICDDGICKANIDSTFIYSDSMHLTDGSSALLGEKMGFYGLIVENK